MDNNSFFCDKTLKCINLWQSVISQVFSDSISRGKSPRANLYRKRARAWVIEADPDFHFVCALAHMSPHVVKKMFLIKIREFCGEEEYKEVYNEMLFNNTLQDDKGILQFMNNMEYDTKYHMEYSYQYMVNWGVAI